MPRQSKNLSLKLLNKKINRVSLRDKPEVKSSVTNAYLVSMPITGSTIPLTQIGQGIASTQRIGLETKATGVELKYNVQMNASATYSVARVMLVVDRQQVSDTALSLAEVVQDASYITSLGSEIHRGRFTMLYDRTHVLTATNSKPQAHFKKRLNLPVKYNGANSGDIQKNGVYLVIQSDQSTYIPLVSYSMKYAFTDA